MVISWSDTDFKEPTLLKYRSETDYKLEEAEIYLVEENEFREL